MDLVSVVISIYNPEPGFFRKQLVSLEEQDYENLEVLIRDDNPNSDFDPEFLDKIFKKKKYSYIKGKKNLGYARSFENLTKRADGVYIAYCDQDDIWLPGKISRCVNAMEKENGIFATTDRSIIDENDRIVERSYRENHHNVCDTWKTGDHITPYAVFTTFAIGMSIVMKTEIAKALLPLPKDTAHDKWLTAGASVYGKLIFIDEPMVQYRRHSQNVSGVFHGLNSKNDYYLKRVDYSYYLAGEFLKRFPGISEEDKKVIEQFAEARKRRQAVKMYSMRKIAPEIIKFEIVLKFLPGWMFKICKKIL